MVHLPFHQAPLALVRFYLDEDLPAKVAVLARAQGVDVVACSECGRYGLSDEAQLRLAAEDGRCLVTRNRDDFTRLTTLFFDRQWPHAGVLIVSRSLPNRNLARLTRALVAYSQRYEGDVPAYLIDFLTAEPID